LGNFIFQLDLLEPVANDLYEQYKMDGATTTDAEFDAMWNRATFGGDIWYQSVVTTSRFEKGRVAEIRLHPIDLSYTARGADRGQKELRSPKFRSSVRSQIDHRSAGTRL